KLYFVPPLQHLYLNTKDPYGPLARQLKEYLKISGVHITDKKEEATTVLSIINEITSQQLIGISGTQQTRQYNLTLSVTFVVEDIEGKALTPPQTLQQTRTLTIQADQILAGSNEANLLYHQMRSAIVYDVLNRLTSKEISKLLMSEKT
ncbi:MAG TPA: LPS assembly lipoprotein LptE, partial [Gammaproteobacteria bacterium]|nr:LPS assembly lipoprotein LptE [Gammaproteobacteria bacterium]